MQYDDIPVMTVPPPVRANSMSPMTAFAEGMTERAKNTFYLPADTANYLLGVDRQWGERRSFFANVGTNYNSWRDPLHRVAHVGNGLALGTINFISLGTLHPILECLREALTMARVPYANPVLRTVTSYMKPPPGNAYEMGEWAFDSVFVLSATKATMEYRVWSGPIRQRTALMDAVAANYRQALINWATQLGNGSLEAALPQLAQKALSVPDLASPTIGAKLAEGTRAMVVLDMVSSRHPQVVRWLGEAGQAQELAPSLIEPNLELGASLQLRLLILARHNPDAVIQAVLDAVLRKYAIPAGEAGAGGPLHHAASPHLDLLRQLALQPALRPKVLNAYGTIVCNSQSVPIATAAAEGIARLLPQSEGAALQIINGSNPLAVYAMARALILSGQKLSPAIMARLKQIPLLDYVIIIGREPFPYPVVQLLQALMQAGNPHALPTMRTMLEVAHPFAYQVLVALRRLRTLLPGRAEEISACLRTLDTNVIENDVIFSISAGDYALASDNAALLAGLAREGNVPALQALIRLTAHDSLEVSRVASGQWVELAIARVVPSSDVLELLEDPHPRIRRIVEDWSVRDPMSFPDDLRIYCNEVLRAEEFPSEALYVLQAQARAGKASVGRAVSRLFEKSGQYRYDLLRLLQQYPTVRTTVDWHLIARVAETMVEDLDFSFQLLRLMVEEASATAPILKDYNPQWFLGAANAGRVEGVAGLELLARQGNHKAYGALRELADRRTNPRTFFTPTRLARQVLEQIPGDMVPIGGPQRPLTVQVEVTQLDLQHGRAMAVAEGALSGSRPIQSSADLEVLGQGVQLGTAGALDALYKVAREGGEFAAEAQELLLRLGNRPDSTHQHTIQVMTRVLAGRHETPMTGPGPVGANPSPSLRYLETLVTVSDKYAAMAMDELMRQVGSAPDAVLPILRRLVATPDERVVNLVSERLVKEGAGSNIPIHFFRDVLNEESSMGSHALRVKLRFFLDTSHQSTPLDALRDMVQ